ncbi:hypothetical protein [Bacillus thuringiensis]|uniref:hypothetical protein n=1 Tax=Bacillus thuringiensis TaxID=1428 RepID=UPI001F08C87A|nr:hypothetical protein [Bacillus thuringiensis]
MKLTDYNTAANILGYPVETLQKETDSLILPSKSVLRGVSKEDFRKTSSSHTLQQGNMHINLFAKKILMDNIISPSFSLTVVVSDSLYEQIQNTPHYKKQRTTSI